MAEKTNPWGLTPRQSDVMDAMCKHGCQKLAARALNISTDTVVQHIWMANQRMGFHTGNLTKYLEWDRWRRGTSAGTSQLASRPSTGDHR